MGAGTLSEGRKRQKTPHTNTRHSFQVFSANKSDVLGRNESFCSCGGRGIL